MGFLGKGLKRVLFWAAGQFFRFVFSIYLLLAGWCLQSLWRRDFRWGAFGAGTLVTFGGLVVVWNLVLESHPGFGLATDRPLWAGLLGSFWCGGFVTARIGRRIGMWEGYLSWLLISLLVYLYLAVGLSSDFLGTSQVVDSDLGLFAPSTPGIRLFGGMWDRLFWLWSMLAFLFRLVGASIAYLLFGEDGRLDLGIRFEWMVARKQLVGRTGIISATAVVAVLGVALGVAALISVTAVMTGYQEDVQTKILSTNAHLVVQKYGVDFEEYEEVKQKVLGVKGVLHGSPFTFNEAMLSDGELGLGVLVKGVDPQTAGLVTDIESNLCLDISLADASCARRAGTNSQGALAAALEPQGDVPVAILGLELFKRLGQKVGADFVLTTPIGISGAKSNAPKRMTFRIGGVFKSGMWEFDSRLLYVEMEAAQRLVGFGKAVSGVEFKVSDPEEVERLGPLALGALNRYPYRLLDWRDLNSGIFTALQLQKVVMFLVLCSIIIVAAFNIASTLFMGVVEKSREIGVLKSMGARNSSIMKVFVLEGWCVGLVGTLLGLFLGLSICALLARLQLDIAADVYMVSSLQVRVDSLEVLGTVVAALLISHLATLYPALKAARQHPVDAMRYN